jgi:hypothetical protein
MALPTLFAPTAANPFEAKSEPQGIIAEQFTLTLPAGTALNTTAGLVRFQRGFTPLSMAIVATDMDTATTLVLDIGYTYDNNATSGADVLNAFVNDSTIGQAAGSLVWPTAGGLLTGTSFTAAGDGYITLTNQGEAIEVAGTVTGIITYTYNVA